MRLGFSEEHPFHALPHYDLDLMRDTIVSYPMVRIRMTGKRGSLVDTYGLVDSGADRCLFHAYWLQKIGLRLKDGRHGTIGGIKEGAPVSYYAHKIALTIGDNSKPIRCEIAFSDEIGSDVTDQLVGRDIIFDRFRFAFRQSVQMLYVEREV